MGTSGLIGFYFNGKYYVTYNHMDSYPDGLGDKFLSELQARIKQENSLEGAVAFWERNLPTLKFVYHKDDPKYQKPTPQEVEKLRPFTDLGVGSQSEDDWYCLLRYTQGSFEATFKAGVIENAVDKNGNITGQEYAYIVNLDTNNLEFFNAGNKKEFPLSKIPGMTFNDFGAQEEEEEEKEAVKPTTTSKGRRTTSKSLTAKLIADEEEGDDDDDDDFNAGEDDDDDDDFNAEEEDDDDDEFNAEDDDDEYEEEEEESEDEKPKKRKTRSASTPKAKQSRNKK